MNAPYILTKRFTSKVLVVSTISTAMALAFKLSRTCSDSVIRALVRSAPGQ